MAVAVVSLLVINIILLLGSAHGQIYQGCYGNGSPFGSRWYTKHEGVPVKDISQCCISARDSGNKYFGMEWPQGTDQEGAAQCGTFPSLPSAEYLQKDDEKCAKEYDKNGFRLGNGNLLAVYRVRNDCSLSPASSEYHCRYRSGEVVSDPRDCPCPLGMTKCTLGDWYHCVPLGYPCPPAA